MSETETAAEDQADPVDFQNFGDGEQPKVPEEPGAGEVDVTEEPVVEHAGRAPEDRTGAIMEAIGSLDSANDKDWDGDGKPSVAALSGMLGFDVTETERDRIWSGISAKSTMSPETSPAAVEEIPVEEELLWGVRDLNATTINDETGLEIPRIHEAVPGHRFPLVAGEYKRMQRMFALKFLCDPAFEVVNEQGQKVAPLPDARADRSELAAKALKPDQIVASLAELTGESLFARASQFAGGERFKPETKRDTLIRFISQNHMKALRARRQQSSMLSDGLVEEMDDTAVGNMLGNQSVEELLAEQGL